MVRKSVDCSTYTVFGEEVGWVVGMKLFFDILKRVFGFPFVFWNEVFGVADMSLGPFQFVKFGKILDKILVGLERFGYLADVDYSSACEFIPKRPDNGVG